MGENFFHPIHAVNQLNAFSHAFPHALDGQIDQETQADEEEPYTIKCICGFIDDDGNTVLCERCNTWQHIDCYYYPHHVVPETHLCVDCSPRILDAVSAAQRQRTRVHGLSQPERPKRPSSRPQKKRAKDSQNVVPLQNGSKLYDLMSLERLNGSRDQPPPAKKPKVNHRQNTPSMSLARTMSITNLPPTDGSKLSLADCPPDFLSPEFIKVHQTNDFVQATTNTHLNLGMANLLSQWLDDKDAFAQVTHGRIQGDVFKQAADIEEFEQPIIKNYHEDKSVTFHGHHPVWPYLTIDRDVLEGDMIGEIRGGIGLVDDYKADPANNWAKLHHPEHFVFFHPALPIFIDCRAEGTVLRHARRSCRPNMALETIITGEREYRFCFTAKDNIPKGAEITLSWDLRSDDRLQKCLESLNSRSTADGDMQYINDHISTLLAHFGGCACDSEQGPCLFARFDRRASSAVPNLQNIIKKGRKGKKLAQGVVFQNPSRSGSEAFAQDDEDDDAESTSRSETREPSPTESPHNHVPGSGHELSERERKKLLQQERLFNKMEQDEQHGQKKKKRASGSNFNTPAIGTSKQLGRNNSSVSVPITPADSLKARYAEHSATSYFANSRNLGQDGPSPQSASSRSPSVTQRPPGQAEKGIPRYSDALTQTEAPTIPPIDDRVSHVTSRIMSLPHRLIERAQLSRTVKNGTSMHQTASSSNRPSAVPAAAEELSQADVEMADADESKPTVSAQTGALSSLPVQAPHPPLKPPPPPWPGNRDTNGNGTSHARGLQRAPNLHVELPPPPALTSSTSTDMSISATPGPLSSYSAQSPNFTPGSAMASLVTPGGSTATNASPVKKKMSLSAYTAKLKAKTPGTEKPPVLEDGSTSTLMKVESSDSSAAQQVADKEEQGSSPALPGAPSQ